MCEGYENSAEISPFKARGERKGTSSGKLETALNLIFLEAASHLSMPPA